MMLPPFACSLDGVSLADLDPAVVLTDIDEQEPAQAVIVRPSALTGISRTAGVIRQALTVTIRFRAQQRDPAARAALLDRIAAWAQGRVLRVGYRPERCLEVCCEGLPGLRSAVDWTQELSLRFTARDCPYWQSEAPTAVTLSAAAGTALLQPPGTAPRTPLLWRITPAGSGTVTSVSVAVNGASMSLADSALLQPGQVLRCGLGAAGFPYVTRDGSSVLRLCADASADMLFAVPGRDNEITLLADRPVEARFSARGLWL